MNTVYLRSREGPYHQFSKNSYTSNAEELGLAVSHESFFFSQMTNFPAEESSVGKISVDF